MKLDTFTQSYIETAIWADLLNAETLEHDDSPIGPDDLPASVLKLMAKECEEFQGANADELADFDNDSEAGHLFWLTRNGHGAGFWEYHDEASRKLDKAARVYGSAFLTIDDEMNVEYHEG